MQSPASPSTAPRPTVDAPDPDELLLDALELHDPGAREHAEATAAYAFSLAAELGLGRERATLLRRAARLHDVGNIYVPQELLQRQGRLTIAEFEKVREHADAGYRLLTGSGLDPEPAGWVLHHHERPDGSGYPNALLGDSIPLESRIIAVACAFHSLHCQRPYRAASSPAWALGELRRVAGTQFDTSVVAALERALAGAGRS